MGRWSRVVKRSRVPREKTVERSCWKRTNARTCIKLDKGFDCFMYFEKRVWDARKISFVLRKRNHIVTA